jgi:hypothetical protein
MRDWYSRSVESCPWSGSRRTLLPSSPLRTVRESFPSYRSSRSNALSGRTRFLNVNALAVYPPVTIRMQQHTVLGFVWAAF